MAGRAKLAAQGIAVAAVAGLLALLVWKLVQQGDSVARKVARGERPSAPGFTLPRLDRAGDLSLASLRGNVVVLNFWASWCIPCKSEARRLADAQRRWRNRGVVVVGVDQEDFTGDARAFIRRYGADYPNVYDGPGKLSDDYGLTGRPETFFIDRDGRVVSHVIAEIERSDLEENIQRALAS